MFLEDNQLMIPSKSFVVGEYFVLKGGSALVWLHEPFFALGADNDLMEIHKDSPAGKLFKLFHRSLEVSQDKLVRSIAETGFAEVVNDTIKIRLSDPHKGKGGYGRSTAEFLAVLYICSLKFMCFPVELTWLTEVTHIFDLPKSQRAQVAEKMWTLYKEITRTKSNYNPSGVDLAAQLFAKGECILAVNQSPFYINKHKWPFEEAEIKTVSTKAKLNTHEHLKDLKAFSCAGFSESYNKTLRGLTTESLELFAEGINEYQRDLITEGLQDKDSKKLIEKALSMGAVAAKGCGAMGVDTYLTVSKV